MTAPLPNNPPPAESTDLRDYVRPIWAHKLLIIALVVVATVGTYVYYNRKPQIFQSSTTVFVGEASGTTEGGTAEDQDRVLTNQTRLVQTADVAARVARKIGYRGDPRTLLGGINIVPTEGSDFVTVTSTAGNAQVAAALANAFAQAFIDFRSSERRKQTQDQLDALQEQLDSASGPGAVSLRRSVQARINQLQLAQSTPSGDARQIDRAFPAATPNEPRPKRNALFAFALSLLLGIIAAFGLERIDRRLRSVEEAERIFGLPVIAAVRHDRNIAERVDGKVSVPESVRETFRSLRGNIDLASDQQPLRTVLVTSAVPAEGKSTVVRNLAIVCAEAGLRVAVVEADLRRPTLGRLFGVNSEPGLTDVLMGLTSLGDVLQDVPAHVPEHPVTREHSGAPLHGEGAIAVLPQTNGSSDHEDGSGRLRLIASGPRPADPPAMFAAPSLRALVDRVAEHHDIVFIDSPPLLAVSDAIPLMTIADATILVCRQGTSTVDGAERLMTLTGRVPGVRILGLVVNDVEEGIGERYAAY
jgi:Mrp family chromosome partitioning ATPase/capsular polysaccharide biosynthesis protein